MVTRRALFVRSGATSQGAAVRAAPCATAGSGLRAAWRAALYAALGTALCAGDAAAQVVSAAQAPQTLQPAVLIVPQQRVFPLHGTPDASVRLEAVQAVVTIVEQVATTSLQVRLVNTTAFPLQAEILLPVPAGAVVRGFDFEGQADQPTARLLPEHEARQYYESLVRQVIDPALLEFAGHALIRSSVFPVPPNGQQAVSLVWEQVLPAQGARVDYVLPRSQHAAQLPVPWQISVRLASQHGITTTWSPSHEVRTQKLGRGEVFLELAAEAGAQPGAFQLSWLRGERGLATSFLAAPDTARDGGYVVMLSGVPDELPPEALPREVSIVLDRSGSMSGEKFDQALEAARQILEGLKPGEAFNLIDYSDKVASFAPRPVVKDEVTLGQARQYLDLLTAGGGTNIHDALAAAVGQPATEGFLPVVLFLTDGVPTTGTVDEKRIREATRAANVHGRRLFTFGVGDDVNAPLLDALAGDSRALSSFVRPKEDVEVKVGEVYRRLFGPVLVEPVLEICDAQGQPTSLRIREQEPSELPDLYAGDQLLVAALYHGSEPITFRLTGRGAQGEERLESIFDPATASAAYDFVPRLWASRRIGTLVDEVRQSGSVAPQSGDDPALGEVVQEIVALSTRFGILTEYTAFMATEGSPLFDPDVLRQRTRKQLASRAQKVRTGREAVSQAVNIRRMRKGAKVDRLTAYLDGNLQDIEVSSISHVGDLTFFHQADRWIDARIIGLMHASRDAQAATAVTAASTATPVAAAPAPAAPVSMPASPSVAAPVAASVAAHDPLQAKPLIVEFATPEYFQVSRKLTAQGHAGVLALSGTIVTLLDDRRVVIRPPVAPKLAASTGLTPADPAAPSAAPAASAGPAAPAPSADAASPGAGGSL